MGFLVLSHRAVPGQGKISLCRGSAGRDGRSCAGLGEGGTIVSHQQPVLNTPLSCFQHHL